MLFDIIFRFRDAVVDAKTARRRSDVTAAHAQPPRRDLPLPSRNMLNNPRTPRAWLYVTYVSQFHPLIKGVMPPQTSLPLVVTRDGHSENRLVYVKYFGLTMCAFCFRSESNKIMEFRVNNVHPEAYFV